MNSEALNSAAPVSWTKRRRSKRVFDDDYFADCLIALARSGGAASASFDCTSGHQCSICGKIFASGQALGGHKRKHYGSVVTRNRGLKSDGGVASTKIGGGTVAVDMAPVVRDLVLKLPLPPS